MLNKTNLFIDWGSHEDTIGSPYLTAAASLGLTTVEINVFVKKLEGIWKDFNNSTCT